MNIFRQARQPKKMFAFCIENPIFIECNQNEVFNQIH